MTSSSKGANLGGEECVPLCRRSHLLANFVSQNLSLVNVSTLLSPPNVHYAFPNLSEIQRAVKPLRLCTGKTGATQELFYLIRTAGLVQCVLFVLEGTGGCSSWSLPPFPPLHSHFSSYSFLAGHYFVHEVVSAGINCLKLQRTGN